MSPRKTRRVAKTEAGDESFNITDEGQRKLRTRQLKLKNLIDIDASPQLNEPKQPVKKARNRRTNVESVDITGDMNESSSKKKNKKDKEIITLEDTITSDHSQIQDVLSTTKSNTARGRIRGGKRKMNANKSSIDEENENNENIGDKSLKNVMINENDSISNEDNEVAAASKKNKKNENTSSSGRHIQLRKRNVNSPNPTVTPESSPITVSLTPHRSTKTPRKSPINIGSPKTHSEAPQRTSKTPRKLPVVADSPVPSEESSSIDGTPQKVENLENSTKKMNSSKSLTSVARKSSRISRSNSSRVISTRAKKSPVKSSPVQSPLMHSFEKKVSMISKFDQSVKSPKSVLERIPVPAIHEISEIPLVASNISDREIKKNNRLQDIKNHTPLGLTVATSRVNMISSTPRERIRRSLNLSQDLGVLPLLDKSPLKVESFYGTSANIFSTQNENSNINIKDITNPLISDDESFDVNRAKLVENNEETNVDEVEITDDESKTKDDTYELAEPKTPSLKKQKSNDTYELDEPKTPALKNKKKLLNTELVSKNEVEETIQKRACRVRFASPPMNSPTIKDKSNTRNSRSATPGNKLISKRPGFITKRSPTKVVRPSLIDKKNSPKQGSPRKRSSSVGFNASTLNNLRSKKRSLSSVDVNRKSISKAIEDSVNRLSKPRASVNSEKKPEIKPMSAKKIPNFAQIHQRKFSKMESLVDAKKRLEERHHELINNISTSHSKVEMNVKSQKESTKRPIPTAKDAINGVYNRYGYKVRKEEATKIINKQIPTKKIEDTRTEKRMALKGVRSNRRFDMLMKMRNINH